MTPRITGVVLVRDEDLTVGQALKNAAGFCDEWILCDHGSKDRTPEILKSWAAELPAAVVHRIKHPRQSHELVRKLSGQRTWVFGLDGDEIYDPAGLARLRSRIQDGEFATWWMLLGNVLHVTGIDSAKSAVRGHLSPPCRSMTKLYNFAAIDSWDGYCVERLHGGRPVFRQGFNADRRLSIHESTAWENSDFRCLHLCFQNRSSLDKIPVVRANIMDSLGPSRWLEWLAPWRRLRSNWKHERYRRGPEVTVDGKPFLGPATQV